MIRRLRRTKVAVGAGLLICALSVATFIARAETTDRAASTAVESQSSEQAGLEKKLKEILKTQEQILANQATILQKFDAVMEELRIIKVRATIRGS